MTKEQVIKNFISDQMREYKMMIILDSRSITFGWNIENNDKYVFDIRYKKYYLNDNDDWHFISKVYTESIISQFNSYLNIHHMTFQKHLKEYLFKRIHRYEKKYKVYEFK